MLHHVVHARFVGLLQISILLHTVDFALQVELQNKEGQQTMRSWLLCQAAVLGLLFGACTSLAEDSERRLFVPQEVNEVKVSTQVSQPKLAFPPLPASRAPDQPGWSNSIAICTCIKDEQPADLQEWVQYHKYALQIDAHRCMPVLFFHACCQDQSASCSTVCLLICRHLRSTERILQTLF
jgi:hypothetical protein